MNIKWDAENYQKNFRFVHQYGEALIDLIDVPKNSLIVDLGCGSGALSQAIYEKGFRVLGIDASESMLTLARKNCAGIDFVQADALSFTLEEKADVIFSNAVFHWIDQKNQPRLIRNLYRNLKKGGRLIFEFGGAGNAETVHSALEELFHEYGLSYPRTFYFPTMEEYTTLLEENGFKTESGLLFNRRTKQEGQNGLQNWIRMFITVPFQNMEPDKKREDY